jgi:hypothetical protein
MSLVFEKKKIKTNRMKIFFFQGKPFLIQGIFLLKNSKEWFDFLTFIQYYSKKTGLTFSEVL